MVRNSVKIIALAAITLLMTAMNITDGVIARPDLKVLNSQFYKLATFVHVPISFAVLSLHVNHIPGWRRNVVISVIILFVISFVLSLRFVLKPPRWDIEFRLVSYCNGLATIVFLFLVYLRDTHYTIVSSIVYSLFITSFIQHFDPLQQPCSSIIFFTQSTIAYAVICWLYVSRATTRKLKIVTMILFFSVYFGITQTYIFLWFSNWPLLSNALLGIDTALLILHILYKRTRELLQEDHYRFLKIAELPTRFIFEDLEKATENFCVKIGRGGSGTVFKGSLSDGSIIAVKQIKGQQSGENEFKTEITIMTSLQHINLVQLLGYCLTKRGDKYLIYPFFKNGSLDAWIFADEEKRSCLTWVLRYQITVDVAKALAYLHHDCRHRILHLDVKPANILLDDTFRALVSDFGISRSTKRDEANVITRARGTVGYLPPEMLVPQAISTKSDVYSYGMVLFELIGGRRNFQSTVDTETRQRRSTYFPKIARDKMKEGKLMEAVDRCVLHSEHVRESEVILLVNVAFWCIQENPELRPNMIEVVDMLEGRKEVNVPPESPMLAVNFLDVESHSSYLGSDHNQTARSGSNRDDTLLSKNTLSISIVLGR